MAKQKKISKASKSRLMIFGTISCFIMLFCLVDLITYSYKIIRAIWKLWTSKFKIVKIVSKKGLNSLDIEYPVFKRENCYQNFNDLCYTYNIDDFIPKYLEWFIEIVT